MFLTTDDRRSSLPLVTTLRSSLGTVAFDSNSLSLCRIYDKDREYLMVLPVFINGGDYWNRTNDPLHVKQVL